MSEINFLFNKYWSAVSKLGVVKKFRKKQKGQREASAATVF